MYMVHTLYLNKKDRNSKQTFLEFWVLHHRRRVVPMYSGSYSDLYLISELCSTAQKSRLTFRHTFSLMNLLKGRFHKMICSIVFCVSGSISIIRSSATVWHILRSHKGVSSTYHRLVFGLCISDFMSSFAYAFSSIPVVPKEMNYLMPFPYENVRSCDGQGFFLTTGLIMATLYNCSVCLYYLAIIRFNNNGDYIKVNLEPWLHGVSVTTSLAIGIIGLVLKMYDADGLIGMCYLTYYEPPHCEGHDHGVILDSFTIPCDRGATTSGKLYNLIIFLLPLTIVPTIIVGTMTSMYRSVRKIESKMLNCGSSTLRLRASLRQGGVDNEHATMVSPSWIGRLKSIICPSLFPNNRTSRTHKPRSQKRAVLYMAMGYSLTWALLWIPFLVLFFVTANNTSVTITSITQSLQGLYNIVVYMSPKVRHARNTKRGKLRWYKAIAKAWMSRGEKDRTIGSRRQLRTVATTSSNSFSLRHSIQRLRNKFMAYFFT